MDAGFFMSGTFKGLTQAQIDRRLKEGRGQGQGRDYKPFICKRAGKPSCATMPDATYAAAALQSHSPAASATVSAHP